MGGFLIHVIKAMLKVNKEGTRYMHPLTRTYVLLLFRNNLRKTRSAALLGIDDYSSSKNAFIGKQGKDFEFSHVYPIKVDFCECSLKMENGEAEADHERIEEWLSKL